MPEGFRRAQEPVEEFTELSGRDTTLSTIEIRSHVVHCAGQDVQLVVESVEFGPRDHQLSLRELQLPGALTRHPVPLSTSRRAELTRAPGPRSLGKRTPTPPATSGLVHPVILS